MLPILGGAGRAPRRLRQRLPRGHLRLRQPPTVLSVFSGAATLPFRDPALAQAGGKLVLVFVDQQSRLIGMAFDLETGHWGSAFPMAGRGVFGAPSAAACGDGRVDVAYVRRDGALAHQPMQAALDVFRPNEGAGGISYSPATTVSGQTGIGDPTLLCSGHRRLELLVTGGDRRLWHNHYTWSAGGTDGRNYTVGWQGWGLVDQPLTRSGLTPARRVAGGVAAAVASDGQVHLVAREWGGSGPRPPVEPQPMWHNSYRAARWGRSPWATVHWRGWEQSGGPTVLGLHALALTNRHADLLAIGADAGLRQAHLGDGIPARFAGGRAVAVPRYLAEPTAITSTPGTVDVVYVGSDDRLRHLRYLDGSLPIDVAVDARPGIVAAARPVAVAVGDQLELIAVGNDRALRHWRYRQGQWSGPAAILNSANAISSPALVNAGAGRLELFAVLDDQRVHHWRFAGAQWTAGRVLPSDFAVRATVFGPLAASSWGDGTVDLVAADAGSGRMYHRHVGPNEAVTGLPRLGVVTPKFRRDRRQRHRCRGAHRARADPPHCPDLGRAQRHVGDLECPATAAAPAGPLRGHRPPHQARGLASRPPRRDRGGNPGGTRRATGGGDRSRRPPVFQPVSRLALDRLPVLARPDPGRAASTARPAEPDRALSA
jgi:hypothetical protein